MSGITMDRRDQVRIGRLLFNALADSTFLSKWLSTNGPFLMERGTVIDPFTCVDFCVAQSLSRFSCCVASCVP